MGFSTSRGFIAIAFWVSVQSTCFVVSLYTTNFTRFALEQPDQLVDKSLLIKAFIEDESSVVSILRPRKWGKTLNLDMVRKFLQVEVDLEGIVLPKCNQTNRKLFTGCEIQLGNDSDSEEVRKIPPLKISNFADAMKHQGIYPVLWLDLEYTKYCSYSLMEAHLADVVKRMFDDYPYLQNYSRVEEQDRLRRYHSGNITTEEISTSMKFLSELLYKHFNRKVFVLVNDYSTPFNLHAEMPKAQLEHFEKIVDLLKSLFCNTFNDNPYLKKGFLTATIPSSEAHSRILCHLNSFTEYTLLDSKFSQFYGYTQSEVENLLNRTRRKIDPLEIENSFKGYNHGDQIVYSPWSVSMYIETGGHNLPWLEEDTLPHQRVDFCLSENDQRQPLKDLVSGTGIVSTILPAIDYQNLKEPSTLYSALLFAGYLNPIVIDRSNRTYRLTIPNEEVKDYYIRKVRQRVKNVLNVDVTVANNFLDMLPVSLLDGFKRGYENFIADLTKYQKINKTVVYEYIHDDLMLALIDTLSSKYLINHKKYQPANETVTVATLVPRGKYIHNVIFIGYKILNDSDYLTEDSVSSTMQLVDSLKFDPKVVKCTEVQSVVRIGIALCKTEATVQYNVETLM